MRQKTFFPGESVIFSLRFEIPFFVVLVQKFPIFITSNAGSTQYY